MPTRFEVEREERAGRILLRLHGTLDGAAARQLQLQIAAGDPRADLVVDFSRLREFQDYAVGVVAHALEGRKAEMRGLRRHHARMFEYFGIRVGMPEEGEVYYRPEELLVA